MKFTLNNVTGLPYIAKSSCPLLSLLLVNMQELRSLDRYLDPYEALRRVRNIKRSLIGVYQSINHLFNKSDCSVIDFIDFIKKKKLNIQLDALHT